MVLRSDALLRSEVRHAMRHACTALCSVTCGNQCFLSWIVTAHTAILRLRHRPRRNPHVLLFVRPNLDPRLALLNQTSPITTVRHLLRPKVEA